MGDYIRGLFGGMKKKGAKKYAGLVFDVLSEDSTTRQYSIKLMGTNSQIRIPEFFLHPYWKKLVYMGQIFPFYIQSLYNVLLSSTGQDDLKAFMSSHILESVASEDKFKVKTLLEEVKQPEKLKILQPKKYYTIYRRSRAFASFVLTPEDIEKYSEDMKCSIALYDDCSYVVSEDNLRAYYYSALLNFLVWKVITENGAFVRHQYLRPLMTIQRSKLEWRNEEWQSKIAELCQLLHKEAPNYYAGFLKRGIRVEAAIKILQDATNAREPFKEIIELVSANVDKEKLNSAIELVCKR
jgi:hypothetical protein